MNSDLTDLPIEDFRAAATWATEWIEHYLSDIDDYPVMSRMPPGALTRALPAHPPAKGEPLGDILADFDRLIIPATTHWNHPGWFALFPNSATIPGIVGEMLTAALNSNAMFWKVGPAATELEQVSLDWLRQMLGLDSPWFGMLTDTASISTMYALAAARERAVPDARQSGLAGRTDVSRLRLYCSELAHSSIDKGAITLGFGQDNVVHIPADAEFRMRPDVLERTIQDDRSHGFTPVGVVGVIGTTGTTSIDPIPALADICERERLWLHVDAAYGGVAGIVPEMRHYLDGLGRADSFVVNPHKWLFTPVDCSALYLRDSNILKRAFSLVPEYLVTPQNDAALNYMDYGLQLGRRFRALKLWMVMRAYGEEGIAARIRHHCHLARDFAGWVQGEPDWQVLAPVHFSLVCYRYAPRGLSEPELDSFNSRIIDRVNESGEVFLSGNRIAGVYSIRLAIGNVRTERRHVERAWALLREAADSLSKPATSARDNRPI
jgi:aromatic-L-amino-acid/L-tryptophan decarboxylase